MGVDVENNPLGSINGWGVVEAFYRTPSDNKYGKIYYKLHHLINFLG